jgi:hypothetical protein
MCCYENIRQWNKKEKNTPSQSRAGDNARGPALVQVAGAGAEGEKVNCVPGFFTAHDAFCSQMRRKHTNTEARWRAQIQGTMTSGVYAAFSLTKALPFRKAWLPWSLAWPAPFGVGGRWRRWCRFLPEGAVLQDLRAHNLLYPGC